MGCMDCESIKDFAPELGATQIDDYPEAESDVVEYCYAGDAEYDDPWWRVEVARYAARVGNTALIDIQAQQIFGRIAEGRHDGVEFNKDLSRCFAEIDSLLTT